MIKIGHRGAKGHVAENTLASFEKAVALHVDAVELDVHMSFDNEIMVIHDQTIDRTTTKEGFVNEFTAATLIELGIPTLEAVFHAINKRCLINIEIKDANATQKVIQLIEKFIHEQHWNYYQFQVSSFDWEILEEIAVTNSKIAIGVITKESIENALAFAVKVNAHSINPYFKLLDQEKANRIHAKGFKIYAWTVNTAEDITFVKSLQVAGIISDFPDRI